jgi:acyl-CoA reductase-like NAD-dependent aldehyde dehydrogenase
MSRYRVGDPTDPYTDVGPMAREDLRDELAAQVAATLAVGGRAIVGGAAPDQPGWWYPPTLVEGAPLDAPMWTEETFGPAGVVAVVDDAEAALTLANTSRYGLGAALWTADLDRAADLAARLRVGSVFVNDLVRSDVRFPVGGVRWSGWGRELGPAGVRQLTNTKTVWMR